MGSKRKILIVGVVGVLGLTFLLMLLFEERKEPEYPREPEQFKQAEISELVSIAWKETIRIASGGAYRGPWRMNESEFHFVDDPTIAINEEGVIGVAWADQEKQDIFFQLYKDGERQFEEPGNVSQSPRIFSWLPRLAFGKANEVYILWQEILFTGGTHGGEIFFARSIDNGKSFSEPLNLSNTPAGAGKGRLTTHYWHNGSLALALGPNGEIYAAWTEYEGALQFARSTDRGVTFSPPIHIAGTNKAPARGPSLTVSAEGKIYIAWTVGEDKLANIHFATSEDHGKSFGEPQVVYETSSHSDSPQLVVDDKGTVHLVFADSPGGLLERYDILYTRLKARDGFERPRRISGKLTEKFDSLNFPSLALDQQENLYVLWELFPDYRMWPQGLGLTFSRDGGETFAPPLVVPGSYKPELGFNGSQQGLLMRKLAVNKKGDIAIVNSTFKANEISHIWLFRGQLEIP